MERNKINNHLEYLSLILVLSYFITHNIHLVFFGMTLSLYLNNINLFNSFTRIKSNDLKIKKKSIEIDLNDRLNKTDSNNINLAKDDKRRELVDEIEEFGFIPSIHKEIDSEIA